MLKIIQYLFIFSFCCLALFPQIIRAQENKTKIYFGSPEPLANSPYVEVLITSNAGNFFCSGTVLAKRKVLTAAHCVDDDPLSISVVLEGNTEIEVSRYKIHPDYQALNSENDEARYDLAMLTLATRVPSNITPVKLSSKSPKAGSEIFIYGYGLDENDNAGTLLFSTMEVQTVNSRHIFALGGGNTCNGDSGGPAIFFYRSKGRLRQGLVGVTSFGSADCGLLDTTFTNVLSKRARRFIKSNL